MDVWNAHVDDYLSEATSGGPDVVRRVRRSLLENGTKR